MAKLHAPVAGFRFAGLAAGIKKPTKSNKGKEKRPLDCGLILADEGTSAAAVFTRNRVKAAPVRLAARRIASGTTRAVLVNSGNANAATGRAGADAARKTTAAIAKQLGVDPALVLPASTGVIGVPLPADKIVDASRGLVQRASPKGSARFARAILTTDRGPKVHRDSLQVGKKRYSVLGIAKGAGMIHPDMATTLAFVVTDAPIHHAALQAALRVGVEPTFNRISVDGDTSTNDMVLALASGRGRPLGGTNLKQFEEVLRVVLHELAMKIVADGEGAKHVATIRVVGARSDAHALRIARTIATSQLVKTALHGRDPNWGRVLGAAGRAGVALDAARAEVRIGDVSVYRDGQNLMDRKTERRAAAVMRKKRYEITLALQAGEGRAHYYTCDLGHAYVSCNADYRS